jgi:carotenoid cleavage dioxygenase
VGSRAEDDGYLVTLTTDMNDDASYCLVFDAARLEDGPVCKLQLPERISSGTHSTWVAGSELRRWRETDTAAAAVGL